MLDEYVQQWSAIQTVRAANLLHEDVCLAYSGMAGDADELDVEGYLAGLVMLTAPQRDLVAQSINELLDGVGSTVDGAHYSDEVTASCSGYRDYLRTLTLSPDQHDFSAPPVGDHTSTSTLGTSTSTTGAGSMAAGAAPGARYSTGNDEGWAVADQGEEESALDEAEFRRLHALYASGLLESGAEERFDRITRQARDLFGVSSASIALITEDSQVIKSVTGPLGQDLPRHLALCATTIQQDRTLVIADASIHPQWRDHPLVTGGPKVRFYAGHPVSTADGWRIGTLCLMDDQPHAFTEDDVQALKGLAAQVQIQMWV